MLTILGPRSGGYCDGVSRRGFLRIGALGVGAGAFSLTDLLRAEAAAGRSASHKAVINIFLGGGPPHQDMWDLKPDAPAEIRGEFRPIDTCVPGIRISEVFPRMARLMDKCALIRSLVGATGGHDAVQCMTGKPPRANQAQGGWPSLGAVVAKIQGPVDPSVPPFVGLAPRTEHAPWGDPGQVGFLGPAYAPFKPDGPGMANMTLRGLSHAQLADRKALLASFDRMRRDLDPADRLRGMDAVTERALNVLTSSRLVEALDLSKEDPRVRARYGDGKPYNFRYDGAPTLNEHLLLARRLVEAGVRVVTLTYGRWDSHAKNFDMVRDHGGKLDQCLSALIEDLEVRGLLPDVTVVVWGEFGRTPRINGNAGRDHWPQVAAALLAGGGIKGGSVVGATNRLGEYAVSRPVTFGDVFAVLYKNLGLDPETTTVLDPTGRPTHLVDGKVISEIV